MQGRKRNSRRGGFTLAEVLVAAAFLGICTATITDSLVASLNAIKRSERRAVATLAIKNAIDSIRVLNRKGLPYSGPTDTPIALPGGITGNLEIKTSGGPNLYTKFVQVAVEWRERKYTRSYDDSITMSTYMRSPDD